MLKGLLSCGTLAAAPDGGAGAMGTPPALAEFQWMPLLLLLISNLPRDCAIERRSFWDCLSVDNKKS